MKSAVLVFPGINRERDMARALKLASGHEAAMVWHAETALPKGTDLVVVPGGFSYGDYLRCGAIAARAPVMDAVRAFAADGGLVLGVCNGFQILCEAGLLPGVLMRNARLKFICHDVHLRVERSDTPFTRGYNAGQVIRVPVAHGEGNYEADEETLKRLEGEGRVLYRYCSPTGVVDEASNINGAAESIAGIVSERGNVLGMMPHPENHVEDIMGCTDGRGLFAGLVRASGEGGIAFSSEVGTGSHEENASDKMPRWLLAAVAALSFVDRRPRAGLSQTSHHHDRAVRGRRHLRRDRARGRRADGAALGQPIVIENVAGAGGSTALARAARAEPDGYTIAIGNAGTNAATYTIYPKLPFTPDCLCRRSRWWPRLSASSRCARIFRPRTSGIHRLRQEQSRQDQSRPCRRRLLELSDLQELYPGRRYRGDAGRLSRRGARADRCDRRPDRRRLRCRGFRQSSRSTTSW